MLIFIVSERNRIYLHLQHDCMCQHTIFVNSSLVVFFLAGFEVLTCIRKVLLSVSRTQQTFAVTFERPFFFLLFKLANFLDTVNTGLKLWLNTYLLIFSYIWVS